MVENVFDGGTIAGLRRATDQLVERSRTIAANDDICDLDPSHASHAPRLLQVRPEKARSTRIIPASP